MTAHFTLSAFLQGLKGWSMDHIKSHAEMMLTGKI
jgi:hypothetical protein